MKIRVQNTLWTYIFLLIGLTYVCGLFIDLTGDSGLYAAISRQMVESGDWLNLKINGIPYKQKPHLLFWLAGIGIKVFGNTNFAFKIFPTLWGIAGLYFIYRLGKLIYSIEAGKLAVLIAVTSQISVLYFLDIHTDTVLQTGVILALWQLAAYFKFKKSIHFILGFLGVGLAMLSKGPVGAVIPFFSILLYLIAKKDYKQLLHFKWFAGMLIVLLVISPSLFFLYKNFGWEGIRFYFITNNFGRISGEYVGSSNDPSYYLHTILWAFLPWTIFVVYSIINEIRSWFSVKEEMEWGIYLLGSVLIFTLILSIAKGKSPNYYLSAVAPISIIAGKWIYKIKDAKLKGRKLLFLSQKILILIITVLFLVVVYFFSHSIVVLPIVLILISVVFFLLIEKFLKGGIEKLLVTTLIVSATLNFHGSYYIIPDLFSYQGARQALKIYETNREEGDILKNLQLQEYELFYWANSPVQDFTNWDEMYVFLDKKGAWIYTDKKGYDVILQIRKNVAKAYEIPQRGMNDFSLTFLNPKSRKSTLVNNYLIKINGADEK